MCETSGLWLGRWQVTGPSKTAAAAPRKHRTVQTLPDCTSTSLNLPGLAFKPIDPLDRSARSTVIQGIALVLTWVHSCFSLARGPMSVNAPLLASPHCLPLRSGRRRHTSAWHRLSCAQQQSRLRPAHRQGPRGLWERGRNQRRQDARATPGADTNGPVSTTLM